MDNTINERDFNILEDDRYTFLVLRRIIRGKCELLLTDHERLIICYSCHPFPVWIWTPDNAVESEMERAYQIALEHNLLDGKHTINMKYELANYFIERAVEAGRKLSIFTNMFAYDCLEPIQPSKRCDGAIHQCKMEDVEELVEIMDLFHTEIGIGKKEKSGYQLDAEQSIDTGKMFFWKNELGKNVASCKYAPEGELASVNLVFTRPEFRRMHYAENLVYEVTQRAKKDGYIPVLYTNADYAASNACYGKIGYVLRGKLCTIG